ncbi:uncharacterized protein LOC116208848 [Punica granatum]|nr:uncharacterized protein LOC116208848 [Punica granatum]OWM86335.1 hypothetical protein CDL15_Pgr010677 [Punica granatum]
MADRSSSSRRSGGGRSHQRQASIDYEDLEEENVWSAAQERGGGGGDYTRGAAGPRMIPRGTPSANEASTPHHSSTPVNIPDWSRIYGKSKRKVDGFGFGFGSGSSSAVMWNDFQQDKETGVRDEEEEEEDGEDEGGIVPPHEWIARKLERSQISSNSMCEGIGRTLKGRDLSKVRNAVLTKTGFLE